MKKSKQDLVLDRAQLAVAAETFKRVVQDTTVDCSHAGTDEQAEVLCDLLEERLSRGPMRTLFKGIVLEVLQQHEKTRGKP